MIENIYVIYDMKAKIALKPFMIERNDVVPIRQFGELVNNEQTILHKHPGDFELVQIGHVDLETLLMDGMDDRLVANGLEFVQAKT